MTASPLLVGDILRTAAFRVPRAVAAWHGDRSITFADAEARADALAQAMLAADVQRGDRVAWIAETCIDAMAVHFACAFVGAIFTPLNPKATSEEIDRLLAHCEPKLVMGDEASGRTTIQALSTRAPAAALPLPQVFEDDPVVMYYTSGTTGSPKGCLLSHRTQRLRAGAGSPYLAKPTIIMFPQFHMANWSRALTWWVQGSAVVYIDKADAETIIRAIDRHRSDVLRAIPVVWRRIVEHDRAGYDLSCLRAAETGTSKVTPELVAAIRGAFPGIPISIAYGSTEGWLVCTMGPEDIDRKPGAVGLPSPSVILREGDDGEIMVKSPYLFSGYFRNEEATANAFTDGFFRTGDLAEVDDEGYRTIVGRAGDLIRSGGEWISPAEVESVLQGHPALADAAVIGVPDPDWGQVVTALVVPRAGETMTIEALRQYCAGSLAPHKHPRRLKVVESLPRTPATGQIQRRLLEA
ncbi:class I adenylate-forming enzyme family protein [Sphingomonas bacterium]|uniref:class I adenylate-forming enzyme family protein n=1 Tax=Sphingomonas bacterium TaxID=1895847 RepID=UPI001576DFCC|nr:class I adenylate-forming enzyme family protein [Sphingomonas bacterium]